MRDEITTPHTDLLVHAIVQVKEDLIKKAINFKLGREDWMEDEIKSRCVIKFTGNNTEVFVMDVQEMVMFTKPTFALQTMDDTVKITGFFEYKELYLVLTASTTAPPICPGGGKCEKEIHDALCNEGYVHSPDFDGPYKTGSRGWLLGLEDKDDPQYCGRCHKRLKEEG